MSKTKKYYTLYHCHSDYSLLDSCTKYQDYIKLASESGAKAISISEHGKPLNWTEKWHACKEAGLRYIHSVEIYLTESLEEKVRDNYHTVLMARNKQGILELNELVSRSCNEDHFYYTNRISFDEFLGMSDNIISTSACLASPLNKLSDDHPRYMEIAKKYNFLEVQPHSHPEQVEFNKRLLRLSEQIGTPLIAGTDTHSSSKYKAECRSVLLTAKHKSYGDEDTLDLTYKTYDELVEMFRNQGALSEDVYLRAIENTNKLYDMTEEIDLDVSIKYPILYGTREADAEKYDETLSRKFAEKIEKGIIPEEQIPAFSAAIEEESRVFKKLGMTGFMLSMSELISWCKENDIAIGTARGSVGGSRVAYVADVIDLNPETWHTEFSRFCNEDRVEIGDIDIDCIESDRVKIFEHIIGRFGVEKTARVASFGTLKDKSVIDEVGRCLAIRFEKENPGKENPWSLKNIAKIKDDYAKAPEKTSNRYKELFYYMDGLLETKISQSVHPAGMVISPITLADNFGVFDKDGEICLMLDMENIHDYTGLAKYDFLVLKTVQVIRDTCRYIGVPYPKSHEIDWNDEAVWDSMIKSPVGLFQFESPFAIDSLRKFKPKSIFDMSIVTACIRPSGESYRSELLARVPHKNPSEIIDKLLEDNLGYLIYQEDTIRFLREICGLSGSDADNIRRAIGRKQKDRLDKAMPSILEGYCSKSPQPREVAEKEAAEFLQIIEDSSSYQFGKNHSIAYCLLGYLCAYYRYYYPVEFLTSFLNNAANEADIKNGTSYAEMVGIKITMPKWGVSKGDYFFDKEKCVITKGLASVKYMSPAVAEELYDIAHSKKYTRFTELLYDIDRYSSINSRQMDVLTKIDFFSEFGNQRELFRITEMFSDTFAAGDAKKISKDKIDGTPLEPIVKKYATGTTKSGGEAKSYTLLDVESILFEIEDAIKNAHMEDVPDLIKIKNFADIMGYFGYVSNKPEDRRKLYILDIHPKMRRSDGKQFGYSVLTKSIGSGIETWFTIFNRDYDKEPVEKGNIVYCTSYEKKNGFYNLTQYSRIS